MIGTADEWNELLAEWSKAILQSPEYEHVVSPTQQRSGWMGGAPGEPERIDALERQLGLPLPPSYRTFLQASNGWGPAGLFIDRLFCTDEVDWVSNSQTAMIEAMAFAEGSRVATDEPDRRIRIIKPESDYTPRPPSYNYTVAELAATLQVSEEGDSAFLLLNPCIRCGEEWEAWFFAHWLPGAERYPSFAHMMLDQFHHLQDGAQ